jgi:hypothetical protein
MINERGMKGNPVVSAKLEMSPIRFERAFIVVVLCSGTAIKVPLLAIISTH